MSLREFLMTYGWIIILMFMIISVLITAAFYGTIGYIALHFIGKYW
jgi:hypothetical protein